MKVESYSDIIESVIELLENELRISTGFFKRIVMEDDWGFVIKLSSLFEVALTESIVAKLQNEQLRDVISRLELARKDTGKLELADKLGLINGKQKQFIQMLASLRNVLAHHVRHVEFSFAERDAGTVKQVEKLIVSAQRLFEEFGATHGDSVMPELAARTRKFGVWVVAMLVIGQILTASATCSKADLK